MGLMGEENREFWGQEVVRANLIWPDEFVIRFVKKNFKNPADTVVLDYGCGAGRHSIAQKYGANIPFNRSEKMSDDYATTAQVVMEVLQEYDKRGKHFDYAFCLYPTAPFLTPEVVRESAQLMEEKKPDEIIAVVEFSYPPQRCYSIDEAGKMAYKYKEYVNSRSQDLEKLYHDAGQFYIYRTEAFYRRGGQIVDEIMPMILSPLVVQDIDTEDDWLLAEAKYKLWNTKQ